MTLTDAQRAFLEAHHSAAMITVGDDGQPKVARVGVALVEGRLWSSATQARVRTARLRRDPRCSLFVFEAGPRWLALETTVRILDGPDASRLNLQLFRQMQNRPSGPLSWFGGDLEEADFLSRMESEGRLIYEFDIQRGYGMV